MSIEAAAPSGTVVAYDGVVCPTGWTEFTDANGRVIVGSGNGNTDKDNVPLSARTLNDVGGREVASISLPPSSSIATLQFPGPGLVLGGLAVGAIQGKVYSAAAPDTVLGTGDNDKMPPFLVLKYCRKD